MGVRLTNEIIDKRLMVRNIERLDNFILGSVKIRFKCLIDKCSYIWNSTPNNILRKKGCPKCSNRLKLTNEIVDERIYGLNLKRIDDYINISTKITFQCLQNKCNYLWKTTVDGIINHSARCPKCIGVAPYTNETFDLLLIPKKIKRLTNYINIRTKITFKCLKENCDYIWDTQPTSINSDRGCPKCGVFRKNEKSIIKLLDIYNINYKYNYYIKNLNKQEIKNYNVDFYFPNIDLIIEYNGDQHYKPTTFFGVSKDVAKNNFEKQKLRDQYVENFCKKENIKLIWIDGRKYKNEKLQYYIENLISTKVIRNI